jgi:hypothetical protein
VLILLSTPKEAKMQQFFKRRKLAGRTYRLRSVKGKIPTRVFESPKTIEELVEDYHTFAGWPKCTLILEVFREGKWAEAHHFSHVADRQHLKSVATI